MSAEAVRGLGEGAYRSIPRIALDVALWLGAAGAAVAVDRWWFTLAAAVFIGAVPFHDLLVQGHEGTHGFVSRRRWLNELLSGFTLGLGGISIAAHRAFHLEHHRRAHTPEDPEFQLFNRLARGVPGWTYLLIPAAAAPGVNAYGLCRAAPPRLRRQTLRDLAGIALLHGGLVWAAGPRGYALFVIAPMVLGLFPVSVIRSICEHHGTSDESDWTIARSMITSPLVERLWSNVNYHLEHHLHPTVPFHRLPELRRRLAERYPAQASPVARGYLHTALALLREPNHFRGTGGS
jgi:fatty acid desaturase